MRAGGFVWFGVVVLLSGRVRSLFTCFRNSSMVLVGSGSMNGTSSERFLDKELSKEVWTLTSYLYV